jgi:large subunit ribosomal protein L9
MKIILNQDVANLGELGDMKDVAAGYARNFLLPRGLAVPFTSRTVAAFEKRKSEIEAHKQEKRSASNGLKEKIEALDITILVPAGENGKLYGAVTNQTIVDELGKLGLQIDRKKVEIHDRVIKSAGKYSVQIKLYERDEAILKVNVQGQVTQKERREEPKRAPRRRDVEAAEAAAAEAAAANTAPEEAPAAQE